MKHIRSYIVALLLATSSFSNLYASAALVKDETIALQKQLTHTFTLKNGIEVIYREVPNSDIIFLDYNFGWGLKDQEPAQRADLEIMFDVMPMAAKGWPKAKIFRAMEQYSSMINCEAAIELSSCSLSSVSNYWDKLLPMFAAIIQNPTFNKEDIQNAVEQQNATLHQKLRSPESLVSEVINRQFYPADHGYFLPAEQIMAQLKNMRQENLVKAHNGVMNAALQRIVVVGSIPEAKLRTDLEKQFGAIPSKPVKNRMVLPPAFDPAKAVAFESKQIPTAYISIKTTVPGVLDKDNVATDLMFNILSEELETEIRTKRSLSYAIYAFNIDYHVGVGVIGASTSKPQETLEAINEVVNKFKNRKYTDEELKRFKTVYTTKYFLTLEDHASLGGAIAKSAFYFKSLDPFYNMPRDLDKVTPADIQRLATTYLVNFRVGVVYDEAKFKKEWANSFVKEYQTKS